MSKEKFERMADLNNLIIETMIKCDQRLCMKKLKELLDDAKEAGFSEDEVRESRMIMFHVLLNERVKPGSIFPKEQDNNE